MMTDSFFVETITRLFPNNTELLQTSHNVKSKYRVLDFEIYLHNDDRGGNLSTDVIY